MSQWFYNIVRLLVYYPLGSGGPIEEGGPGSHRRTTNKPCKTGASLVSIDLSTQGIRTTGWWYARNMWSFRWSDHFRVLVTVEKWISAVSLGAGTDRVVVHNFALCISSTGSRTRINTFLLDTGLGQLALRTQETLRPAVGGTSKVSRKAGTDRSGALCSAFTVWSAGIRITRILWLLNNRLNCNKIVNVWIWLQFLCLSCNFRNLLIWEDRKSYSILVL